MNKKIIMCSAIVVVAFLFYWYEWRPSEIKKSCYAETFASAPLRARDPYYQTEYKACLERQGL